MRQRVKVYAQHLALVLTVVLALGVGWFLFTEDARVWPVRNTIQYHLFQAWWGQVGMPEIAGYGTFRGRVTDPDGEPIAGAQLLLARWDGKAWRARTDEAGRFEMSEVEAGSYRPVAGAVGFKNVEFAIGWREVEIRVGEVQEKTIVLPPARERDIPEGTALAVGESRGLHCTEPLESRASRREITFQSGSQPSQPTFLYLPSDTPADAILPTLVAVYPGPVDTWECVSIPLADAGYAVLGIGPEYSLDLERDVDEIVQLVDFVRAGEIPHTDGERLALLAGSYSAFLVQRFLERDPHVAASVLLGPPTDLFDLRYRFEQDEIEPPFGLDQVLIALGFPDRVPMRYWRYSSAYHIRPDLPPLALFHSRSDDIVPYQQSELLVEALEEEGVEYEFHVFDGGNHYLLSADEDALEIYRLTLEFLARELSTTNLGN